MMERHIGKSHKRREDVRFLSGSGCYTQDINKEGQLFVCFARAGCAHGILTSVDVAPALAIPGVVAAFTGADIAEAGLGGIPCGWQMTDRHGEVMREPAHPILAQSKVRHVGDPIAAVLAETPELARTGADAVAIQIEELPAVSELKAALDTTVRVHDDLASNLCFDWTLGDEEAVDAAFAEADHVTKLALVNNRLIPNAMEPRAAIGEYDPAHDRYTLTTTSQNPHLIRLLMGAFVLQIPEHKLRVVSPDVGGGFGSKIFHYAEEALVTWAARKVARPVKWVAERSESFISDAHGRDHKTQVELALDKNGIFKALRVKTIANMGAYLSTFAPCIPTWLHATLLAGQYKTPAIHCQVQAVFTNTTPVDAYRGAGRPEATYLLERTINKAASEMGIDQFEIRRRNFIQADEFPYQTPVALQYDSGDYPTLMDKACKLGDVEGFARRKQESLERGRLRGIGVSSYIEACGIAPSSLVGALGARAGLYEAATVRVNPTGSISVFTGSHSHGQGHETTFAQLVADRLGIAPETIEIVHGDTDRIPFGMGTYGSRSLAVGGTAIVKALDKIIDKSRTIAAHMMEADQQDIDFEDGIFKIKGSDRGKAFGEIALAAYVPHQYPLDQLEPGLEETAFYDPANFTFPAGTYICEIELDNATGQVSIDRFTCADDFGTLINPMIVEGQVHGGLAQGIGQALLEGCSFNEHGQLLTGSWMDYTMPRADDMPDFQVTTNATACTHNPLGVKGCGEAGAIGAPSAVVNAVLDAVSDFGIDHIDMPLTPMRVWEALANHNATAHS
ncbi:MAG: xanthine dehydrogenase family protein molybdopterin-binding subunit [Pseudomonadota bacterium]